MIDDNFFSASVLRCFAGTLWSLVDNKILHIYSTLRSHILHLDLSHLLLEWAICQLKIASHEGQDSFDDC